MSNIFECPICGWKTHTKGGCISCIDKHLKSHGINISGRKDEDDSKKVLEFYSKKYDVKFNNPDELDKFINDNNITDN